jgi:homoserine O-succinyltransferase/O-acetyltransferase
MIKLRLGPCGTALRDVSRGLTLRDNTPIVIGLVNNMPDTALQATERQFCDLLAEASRDFIVLIRFFSIPELQRSEAGRVYVSRRYEDIGELLTDNNLDGLIVTGAEPRAPILSDEPYWSTMTKIIDWADGHTTSTVWSCLAAHAAVLHQDGIERRRFSKKLSGVFECEKTAEHEIVAGNPEQWCTPHSRYNDLPENELIEKGYRVLSRSAEVGADLFVRQRQSLSIYLQGHPEYDAAALFREYRRDIRAFVAREADCYPDMPRGYFDAATAAEFNEFRTRAIRDRSTHVVLNFPEAETKLAHDWHQPAVTLYTNWLSYLAEHRRPGDRSRTAHSADASHAA